MKKTIFISIFLVSLSSFAGTKEIRAIFDEAEKGSKSALYDLGVRYGSGDGVKEDNEIANKYYSKSAALGYAPAQNNLGWAYRQGIAVAKNPTKAMYWFRLSALQGNALAIQNLAEMFQQGEGAVKDLEIARSFFILCATEIIGELPGREDGINNAIHECRREIGKIDSVAAKDDRQGLRRAAMWFSVALIEDKDAAKDSKIGLRARRSRKETEELLNKINEKLSDESRKWVNEVIGDWNTLRVIIKDRTPFPLIHEDCFNPEKSI
jgi:hypothetical protein